MNSPLVTLDPVTNRTTAKTILSRDGYTSSLITLESGTETVVGETDKLEEHLLFVVEGGATVRMKAFDIDCQMHRYCQNNDIANCKGYVLDGISPQSSPIDGSFLRMTVESVKAM